MSAHSRFHTMTIVPRLWFLPLLLAGGCSEPFNRAGTWHATGVNRANLDAEVADKADTVAGHGLPGSDAVLDTAAVERLYEDKTKPLRNESTTGGGGGQ